MSNVCLTLVRSLKTGHPLSKALLHLLADHVDDNFEWRISLNDLAEESEMSLWSVKHYMKHLEDKGFIQRVREKGRLGYLKTLYRVTVIVPNKCSRVLHNQGVGCNTTKGRVPHNQGVGCNTTILNKEEHLKELPLAFPPTPQTSIGNGNGNGNGNGHGELAIPAREFDTSGGKVHLCQMCQPEHEWLCFEEFDDMGYTLACPGFRQARKR